MHRQQINAHLPAVVESVVASVESTQGLAHLNRVFLPSRDAIISAISLLRQISFPGFHGPQRLTTENIPFHIGQLLVSLSEILYEQIRFCLRYRKSLGADDSGKDCDACDRESAEIVSAFLDRIPHIRSLLAGDVQAAFDADPAAQNTDETILCYPGLLAILVQRYAHEFYSRGVPMLPRIMTEWAHSQTGIDIHPGATLGPRFFIDHGTGIVIGETCTIGANVRIYQGVTLGGLSPDRHVEQFRGRKRHPTIEDDVTIYAGATILGGDTTIGRGSAIGGNVFITSSVPPDNQVTSEPPTLKYRQRRPRNPKKDADLLDFQI